MSYFFIFHPTWELNWQHFVETWTLGPSAHTQNGHGKIFCLSIKRLLFFKNEFVHATETRILEMKWLMNKAGRWIGSLSNNGCGAPKKRVHQRLFFERKKTYFQKWRHIGNFKISFKYCWLRIESVSVWMQTGILCQLILSLFLSMWEPIFSNMRINWILHE